MTEADSHESTRRETIVVKSEDGKRQIRRRRQVSAQDSVGASPTTDEVAAQAPESQAKPKPKKKAAAYVATPTVIVEGDFESLFAAYESGSPDGRFEPGDSVDATVEAISVDGSEIFLDLGGKATGFVLKDELMDAKGELRVSVGDTVSGVVAGISSNGVHVRTSLGRGEADLDGLRAAHESGLSIEGRVEAVNSGGFEIDVGGVSAFCPMSHMDIGRIEDTAGWLGRVLTFQVLEMKERSAVLSRRALLEAERVKNREEIRGKLVVGARMTGVVRSIQKFGVFVDLGGIDGLIHVSELGWGRVTDPNDVVSIGQEVEVDLLEVNLDTDRISLSLKASSDDPFIDAVRGLAVGSLVDGSIVRLTSFGAFMSVGEGVDGLIHVSDMAHYHIKEPSEILTVGDSVRARITRIDIEERRIGLSLKALADDPWSGVSQRYTVGQAVQGTVSRIASFGVFVDLEEGVTALLPGSQSGTDGKPLTSAFRIGRQIEARVLRIDPGDRKMALTCLEQEEVLPEAARGADGNRSWEDQDASSQDEPVGSFGALLKAALGGGENLE
jgi:small subunit ribosomal protein S1